MLKKQYLKNKSICKVTFSLPLEAVTTAKEVKLLGDFNSWDENAAIGMKASKTDFSATVELEAGRQYEFRYLVDNQSWENDWEADAYVPTPFGVYNSVVVLEAVVMENPAEKPAKKASPKKTATAKDDLTKIEGIGPKIAEILEAQGIATFDALSKAKAKDLKTMLEAAGSRYKMHDPTTWATQAKLAAKGDWDKLTALQSELKGGKK